MTVSQNGWAAFKVGTDANLTPLKWITGRVRKGNVHTLFDLFCQRYSKEVEPITVAHSWGYANRAIRGAAVTSNHASGTAIDLNAPKHPLGRSGTFTPAQVKALRKILKDFDGVIRWGGDYSGRKDEMHFEIVGTAARVAAVVKKLTAKPAKPVALDVKGWQAQLGVTPDGSRGPITNRAIKRKLNGKHGRGGYKLVKGLIPVSGKDTKRMRVAVQKLLNLWHKKGLLKLASPLKLTGKFDRRTIIAINRSIKANLWK